MLNYHSMKLSGERIIYKGIALLPFLPLLTSSADAVVCTACGPGLRKIEIISEYGIGSNDGAKVSGAGASAGKSIMVQLKPQTEYTFNLTTTVQHAFSHGGTVSLGCGVQCSANYDSGSYPDLNFDVVKYLPFLASGPYEVTPSTFVLRLDEGEDNQGGDGGENEGASLASSAPFYGLDPQNPGQLALNEAKIQLEISAGRLAMGPNGTAPYRSAGLLAWYGAHSSNLASPTQLEYLGVQEVKGKPAEGSNPAIPAIVTYSEGVATVGGAKEMHLVTPTRVFRVTGYAGSSPGTIIDYDSSSATRTYVREYVRASSSEPVSTTFGVGNAPISWWKITPTPGGGIAVEKSVDGKLITTSAEAPSVNELVATNGSETAHTLLIPLSATSYEEQVTHTRGGIPVSKTIREYELLEGEARMVRATRFPDLVGETDPLVTEYDYYRNDIDLPYGTSPGQLRWVSEPGGNWKFFRYSSGTTETFSPFASETYLDPAVTDQSLLPIGGGGRYRKVINFTSGGHSEYISDDSYGFGGLLVDSSFSTSFKYETSNSVDDDVLPDDIPLIRSSSDGSWSVSYSSDIDLSSPDRWLAGEIILSVDAKGKAEFHEYEKDGEIITKSVTSGIVSDVAGGKLVDGSYFHVVPNLSDRVVQTFGRNGLLSTERFYHTGSEFVSGTLEEISYDTAGNYTTTSLNGVVIESVSHPTPYQEERTDGEGRVTTTTRNTDGEVVSIAVAAGGGVPAQITTIDVVGLTTTTRVNGVIATISTVDGVGRVVSTADAAGAITSYTYPDDGRTKATDFPGPVTTSEESYYDGRAKSVSGNGAINEFYSYGVYEDENTFEVFTTTTYSIGSGSAHSARASTREFRTDGKLAKVISASPEPLGGNVESTYNYTEPHGDLLSVDTRKAGATGKLSSRYFAASESAFGSSSSLFGAESAEGFNLDQDEELTFGSPDRFSRQDWSYVELGGVVYRRSRYHLYPNGTDDASKMTTTLLESLSFVPAGGGQGYTTVIETIEPSGRSVKTTREILPATATVITTEDDSATKEANNTPIIDSVSTSINGYPQTVQRAGTAKSESYAYDAFGRVKRYTDIRQASSWSFYYNGFQMSGMKDHLGRSTTYTYYQPTEANAGRVKTITHPGGSITELFYNERGQTTETSGTANYRQIAGYDEYGARTTLQTFGSQPALTRWKFDPATGMLERKRFNDAAETGKGYDFEYTADGKLAKRTSARGVITDYTYDPVTRDLTDVDYSGDSGLTPDITYSSFDHFGRPGGVSEVLGSSDNIQTLSYQPHSGAVTVAYDGAHQWLPGVTVEQTPDDSHGRPTGFRTLVGTAEHGIQAYQYDTLSRLERISSADISALVSYLPGTSSLQSQTVSLGGQVIHDRALAIDLLGRNVGVNNRAPVTGLGNPLETIASVGHVYDVDGHRKNARREDGTRWDYDYNDRSEVTSAVKKTATQTLVPGLSYGYQYDGIGNRTSATFGTAPHVATLGYSPNALNQYSNLTHPGKLDILSRSDASVTATAPGATVDSVVQEGNLYNVRLNVVNSSGGKMVSTTLNRSGTPSGLVESWVPPANFSPSYDLDGNVLNDGRWTYSWDGEDRLVSLTPVSSAPNVQLNFAYDYWGRRIGKTVVDSSQVPAVTKHMSYAYDNWNAVAEWERSSLSAGLAGSNLRRTHLWGLDLRSSGKSEAGMTPEFSSAGGIGGLIGSTYYTGGVGGTEDHFIPSYNTNGDIIAWSSGGGTLLQRMDYDPFGNRVLVEKFGSAGLVAKIPDYGFSTTTRDRESGLCYYGYRYYNPAEGRWLARDPIQERGGLNLYGFVDNSPISAIDVLGLSKWKSEKGKEAIKFAKAVKADFDAGMTLDKVMEKYKDHACCALAKACGDGDCITFAAGVIRCGYLLSDDKDMAKKISQLTHERFNANELSKVLDEDEWRMVVYAKDSRRVLAQYTGGQVPPFEQKTGEKISETFGAAIKTHQLYGITVHGAIYDLDPLAIKNEGPRVKTPMPKEEFAFLSGTEGYHTGLYSEETVYNSPGLKEETMVQWVNHYNATQIGWLMLAPDSLTNMPTYKKLLEAKKNHKAPKVIDSDDYPGGGPYD